MLAILRKHRKVIFAATTLIFLAGIFVGLGSYVITGGSRDAAAKVGGDIVSYQKFYANYTRAAEMYRDKNSELGDETAKQLKKEILNEMVVQTVLAAGARGFGIRVPDFELAADVRSNPLFQHEGAFNREMYYRALYQVLRTTPQAYEDERRAALLSSGFRNLAASAAKATPQEIETVLLSQDKKVLKDYEKDKARFSREVMQAKTVALLNSYLNQYISEHGLKSYLDEREKGL